MFNLGGGEILVIMLLALIVLGPQRLPEAARKLGNAIGEVRRMATGFQSEIKAALDDAELTTSRPTTPTTTTPTTTTTTARPVSERTPPPGVRSPNGATPSSIGPATPAGVSGDGGKPVDAAPDGTDGAEVVEPAAIADPEPAEPPGASPPGPGSPAAGRDDAVA